jgi:hypothetical protein
MDVSPVRPDMTVKAGYTGPGLLLLHLRYDWYDRLSIILVWYYAS